jgi:deazaflavin-dependent oxidoreductase (nitroreductase family)
MRRIADAIVWWDDGGVAAERQGNSLMPVPRWVAKFNKRVTNPLQVRQGKWPVLTHVGRTSGATYRTPLEAHPIDSGYIFILVYGSDSDWGQNVLAGGDATLDIDHDTFKLVNPRLISKEDAWQLFLPDTKEPPGFLRIDEYLQVDVPQ